MGEESIIKLTQLKFNLNCLFELSFENILFEICMGGHFWGAGVRKFRKLCDSIFFPDVRKFENFFLQIYLFVFFGGGTLAPFFFAKIF